MINEVRQPNFYDADAVSDDNGLLCRDKSLAQQQFKEECDINTIVERFGIGYEMPEGVVAPMYADFEDVFDFQSAMNAVRVAGEAFQALPAAVRARFANDAQRFVEFCSDEKNYDEAKSLGLLLPEAVQARLDAAAAAKRAAEVEAAKVAAAATAAATAAPSTGST